MTRAAILIGTLLAFGALKLPVERRLAAEHRALHFHGVEFNLNLREEIGQLGFVAALSGFRSLVADSPSSRRTWPGNKPMGARSALFRQVTTLQPRSVFLGHGRMAYGVERQRRRDRRDPTQPRHALRVKAQREYFDLGKDFLERGIRNNPDRPQLYEALARLYRDNTTTTPCGGVLRQGRRDTGGAELREDDLPPTSFHIARDREGRPTSDCAQLYDSGEKERLPDPDRANEVFEEDSTFPRINASRSHARSSDRNLLGASCSGKFL